MKRETKRMAQSEATKQKIFETAVKLIKEKGYNKVSIEEICTACGITRGAFYHHFRSKEEIVHKMSMGLDYNVKEFYENELMEQDSLTKVLRIMEYYLSFIAEMGLDILRQLNKIMIDGQNNQLMSTERYAAKILFHSIKEGQDHGEIRKDISAENIAFVLHNFTIGILSDWCSNDGSYDIIEVGCKSIAELIALFHNNIEIA